MDKNKTHENLDNITNTLRQLIEQSQVKAGLLKLEARDAWQGAEKIFHKIGNYLKRDWEQTEQDVDEALLQAHLGMMEAREEWNETKEMLQYMIDNTHATETLDTARLQAHLAKMETKDRFKKKREEWKKEYQEKIKPQLEDSMDEMHREMEIMAKSLID